MLHFHLSSFTAIKPRHVVSVYLHFYFSILFAKIMNICFKDYLFSIIVVGTVIIR